MSDKTFLPFDGDRIARLPAFMEFYRPVINAVQGSIESIQQYTSCPWWLAIGSLTVLVRLSMVPLLLLQMKTTPPLARAMPDLRLLFDISRSSQTRTLSKMYNFTGHFRQITKSHNTKLRKTFLYGFLQVPHFMTYVWSVRSLCATNKALESGGALWFTNLAEPDPYMILPVLSGSLTYLALNV